MCKVMMFTNFRKFKNNKEIVDYIGNTLLSTEKDGFGFAINGLAGVYGEKFIGSNNYETTFFNANNKHLNKSDMSLMNILNQPFGKSSKANGGAIFHGRTSTNQLGFKNTHPIIKHGWHLIHNGVVTNTAEKYEMITDNDSEHLIEHLAMGGIKKLSESLTGYYAFGAFDTKGNLHVGKDSTAGLWMAKLPEYETVMFATTKALIEEFCETFEIGRTIINQVKDNIYMIYDTQGKLINTEFFKSRGWGIYEQSFMSRSLSYLNSDRWDINNNSSSRFNDDGTEKDSYKDDYSEAEAEASYYAYMHEIENNLDESYDIEDPHGETITAKEFLSLDDDKKVLCTVVRPDGTVCDPFDYYQDKFPDNDEEVQ